MDHFSVCEHFSEDFSKEQLIDSGFEKLVAMTNDKQNIFLIQELEHILSEINCPFDYLRFSSMISVGMITFLRNLLIEKGKTFC